MNSKKVTPRQGSNHRNPPNPRIFDFYPSKTANVKFSSALKEIVNNTTYFMPNSPSNSKKGSVVESKQRGRPGNERVRKVYQNNPASLIMNTNHLPGNPPKTTKRSKSRKKSRGRSSSAKRSTGGKRNSQFYENTNQIE